MKFGFGIIGCGMIGKFHAEAIKSLPDAQLVGCFDRNIDSAKSLAETYGAKPFDQLEEMLADESIQIVTIGTPSGAHQEPAVASANHGKHVIVEKPLEVTLEKCDAIIEACERNGVLLSTVFQSRFHEAPQILKRAIDEGRFGKLVLGNAYVKWFRTQEYYDSGAWRGTWALDGGGALMNQAIHSVDLLTWLMGPVAQVSAFTDTLTHQRIEVEDIAVANLRFQNGAMGTIEATTSAFPGVLKKIEIYGSTGNAVIEEEDIKIWEFKEGRPEDEEILKRFESKTSTGGGAADPSSISFEAHAKQFQDVMDSISEKRKPFIDGIESRKSVDIIRGIYDSAKSGSILNL